MVRLNTLPIPIGALGSLLLSLSIPVFAQTQSPPEAPPRKGTVQQPTPHTPTDPRLVVHPAYFDGELVSYITTDVSDKDMARKMGVNWAPSLAKALDAPKALQTTAPVYKFADGHQYNVFPVVPSFIKGGSDSSYTPLWRVVIVHALKTDLPLLKSEDEILSALEAGAVRLERTGIVINCPVVQTVKLLPP